MTSWPDAYNVPVGGDTGQALVKRSAADYDVEWQSPAAPTLSYATFTADLAGGQTDGGDYYPPLTVAASEGTDVTLDVDGLTIHFTPGVYDYSIAYGVNPVGPANLTIFLDGFYSPNTPKEGVQLAAGQFNDTLAIVGVQVTATASTQFNISLSGAAWTFSYAIITFRRVGGLPNP